jgi:hypothetical protein
METPAYDTPISSDPAPIPQPLPGSGLNPPADPPLLAAWTPDPEDDGGGEGGDESEAQEDACAYIDEEAQKRLWVRTIVPVLQLRSHESDPSGRVQLAFDLLHIASCEAISRLLQTVCPRPDGD